MSKLPVNANKQDIKAVAHIALLGTPLSDILDNKLFRGICFSSASTNKALGPVRSNAFNVPNTEINIPTVTSIPPVLPNIVVATSDAGEVETANLSAGNTQR